MADEQPVNRGLRWKATWPVTVAVAFFALAGIGLLFLVSHWPFTEAAVVKALQGNSSRPVSIKSFRKTYVPHPGCIAEGVTVSWNSSGQRPASITIEKLTIQSSYLAVVTMQKRMDRVSAEGLYIKVLPQGATNQAGNTRVQPASGSKKSKLVIGEITADGAIVEVEPDNSGKNSGKAPLKFTAKKLRLKSVAADRTVSFETVILNPEPPGELRATGQVGPWNSDNHGKTAVNGAYTFEHANLAMFKAIAGTLFSKGNFHGVLEHVEVSGTTDTPDFEVTRSGHPVHLTSQFHAIVNGTNGDTQLEPVHAHFDRTTIDSEGGLTGRPGQKGKTVSQELSVTNGRIQDLLRLFLKSNRPPMTGVISLRARALIPPEQRKFIEKLVLQGDFGIGGGRFTSPKTQGNVEKLSERARGDKDDDDDPESVVSDLKGHVVLRNGIATLSNISFTVPGAFAHLAGTYSLLTEEVNLSGTLRMDVKPSQATKGFKSFLLKAIDPLFKDKKRNAGAVVPVKITGTYSHPSFGIALRRKGNSPVN